MHTLALALPGALHHPADLDIFLTEQCTISKTISGFEVLMNTYPQVVMASLLHLYSNVYWDQMVHDPLL
jgi:hypothetical protein